MRSRACSTCGDVFTYRIGRGMDRRHCGQRQCTLKRQCARAAVRVAAHKECVVDGCARPAIYTGFGLCRTCWLQQHRTGSTIRKSPQTRLRRPSGYIALWAPDHPLARDGRNRVYEHRVVLYDALGPGPHACFWCDMPLGGWDEIVADHLNEQKDDNRPENLVVSCNSCNRARGAMLQFIKRVGHVALDVALTSLRSYHASYHNTEMTLETQMALGAGAEDGNASTKGA